MSDDADTLKAGTLVGGTYEVLHQIGRGGMGEVWLAKHVRLPKQVAIKVLRARGGPLPEETLARFRREADVASRLGHPNIAEVHDYNTLPGGAPYLVLEYLEGEPLSHRLQRGPLPLEEARSVVRQVGAALLAAHGMGVVHRDLKPDNIFLLPSPLGGLRVKVLDFGISKIADSDTVKTQEAVLVGTPQYMAPEQATGSNKDVGPQTDVFALGGIAYEMLCGQPPFSGDSVAQVVFRVAYEPHPPLATRVGPEVPATAVQAVERALLKDRAHRTPDVATFVAEFTGQPLTQVTRDAVRAPSPLAVMATPSLALRDSVGLGDTEASVGRAPRDRAPATPSPAASSQSGTKAPLPPGTGRARIVIAWVSVAACLVLGFVVTTTVFRRPADVGGLAQAEPALPDVNFKRTSKEDESGPRPASVPPVRAPAQVATDAGAETMLAEEVTDAGREGAAVAQAVTQESTGTDAGSGRRAQRARPPLSLEDRALVDAVRREVDACRPGTCAYEALSGGIIRRVASASSDAARDALHAERARLACAHQSLVDFQTARMAVQDPVAKGAVRCAAFGSGP